MGELSRLNTDLSKLNNELKETQQNLQIKIKELEDFKMTSHDIIEAKIEEIYELDRKLKEKEKGIHEMETEIKAKEATIKEREE